MKKKLYIAFVGLLICQSIAAQILDKNDKAVYKEKEAGFFQNEIVKSLNKDRANKYPEILRMKFKNDYPTDISEYRTVWHSLPKSQGHSGTCWCFAATSFFESEIHRLSDKDIDLSEMFFVYWDYVDRAEHFVETRGETYFAQGSEANALKRIMKKYGCMPESAFEGKPEIRKYHSHKEMFNEMDNYLNSVKENNIWNKKQVREDIIAILESHMGEMPDEFKYNGKKFTSKSFYKSLPFKANDMFSFMSTLSFPYNEKHELVEPDNWWNSDDYYNVSIDNFYSLCKNAIEDGYSICICGDVSEPGYDSRKEIGIIPDFDIPSSYINEHSRELRLYNKSTTDDHCIQIVGIYNKNDENWFLIKDSGSGGFDGKHKGYRFFHEDYIKLKMMNIMMHKNAADDILDDIIK